MSVVLLGYHNMGCRALKVLMELGVQVPAVFTHEDSPEENIWFDSLAELARGYGIPVYFPKNINQDKWVRVLREISPKIILSCYFRQMVKEDVLSIPKIAAVNLHGSLLPKYRGRCPVNWQLVHGERESGVTLHHMVLKADAGDIVSQKAVRIDPRDTAYSLFKKLEDAAEQVLKKYIPLLLEGKAPRTPQDHTKASYFGGRRPEDGKIDWNQDAQSIYNLVRAVTWPYPGAFCHLYGRKLFIWDALVYQDLDLGMPAGHVGIVDGKVMVQTGKGCLRLLSVSFSNKGSPNKDGSMPDEILRDLVVLE